MELRDIRAFVAVAEELSFTKAAKRLHIAQPPLSRRIRQLEEEWGVDLFVRGGHHIALTREGRLLLRRARLITVHAANLFDSAQRLKGSSRGSVKVGLGPRLWDVFNHVRSYQGQSFPAMSIEVADVLSSRQSEELLARHIDVGFSWHIERSSHLICEPILRARFAARISENDPLARRKKLSLKELAEKPVILLGPPRKLQTIYDKILALYASAGIAPNIITTTDEYDVDNLVASGKGIFFIFLNPLIQAHNQSGIAVVPLSDAEATMDVQLAWRRDETSGEVLRFVNFARKAFELPKRKEAHRKEAQRSIVRAAI